MRRTKSNSESRLKPPPAAINGVLSMAENAVLYLRVATCGQAEGPRNLRNQEKRCRAYCRQMGLNVLGVFTHADLQQEAEQ
jgi:hypothetical protein